MIENDYAMSRTYRCYESELNGEYLEPLPDRFPENAIFDHTFFTGIRDGLVLTSTDARVTPKKYDELSQKLFSIIHSQKQLMQRLDKVEKGRGGGKYTIKE